MEIRVTFDAITLDQNNKVINYYNQNKKDTANPLRKLDRAEGGFQIELDEPVNIFIGSSNSNNKSKQLRWTNKRLISGVYHDFNNSEKELLYNALCSVFGKEYVILE
jgi:hypothetical protein